MEKLTYSVRLRVGVPPLVAGEVGAYSPRVALALVHKGLADWIDGEPWAIDQLRRMGLPAHGACDAADQAALGLVARRNSPRPA
jgi:hypothetical protein